MLAVRFIAWLISLPVLWAGQLASLVKLPVAESLLEAAWWMGGDGEVANSALASRKLREPTEAVLARALGWLARRPRPQIAAYAGILAMTQGNLELARLLLAQGRELGDVPTGLLDLLEASLVMKSDDKAAADELVARWAMRRDLSPAASEFVLDAMLWGAMFRRQWPELERRAHHLWAITNNPSAVAAFWAVDRQRGQHRDLAAALKQSKVPPVNALLIQVQACVAVGASQEADQAMLALEQVDAVLAERTRKVLQQQERTA
jgi:hypothetical protein